MVRLPVTAYSPSPLRVTRVDLKERVGNFSTSKKSALFRCASRWSSRVWTEAASIEASIWDLDTSISSRVITPVTFVNCPLTLEIIMCLTLNSATVWTGSMFQVVVAVCGVAGVLMAGIPFKEFDSLGRYSLQQIIAQKSDGPAAAGGQQLRQCP